MFPDNIGTQIICCQACLNPEHSSNYTNSRALKKTRTTEHLATTRQFMKPGTKPKDKNQQL